MHYTNSYTHLIMLFQDVSELPKQWTKLKEKIKEEVLVYAIWDYLIEHTFGTKKDHAIIKGQMIDECIKADVKAFKNSHFENLHINIKRQTVQQPIKVSMTHLFHNCLT